MAKKFQNSHSILKYLLCQTFFENDFFLFFWKEVLKMAKKFQNSHLYIEILIMSNIVEMIFFFFFPKDVVVDTRK